MIRNNSFTISNTCISTKSLIIHLTPWFHSILSLPYFRKCRVELKALLQAAVYTLHALIIHLGNLIYRRDPSHTQNEIGFKLAIYIVIHIYIHCTDIVENVRIWTYKSLGKKICVTDREIRSYMNIPYKR